MQQLKAQNIIPTPLFASNNNTIYQNYYHYQHLRNRFIGEKNINVETQVQQHKYSNNIPSNSKGYHPKNHMHSTESIYNTNTNTTTNCNNVKQILLWISYVIFTLWWEDMYIYIYIYIYMYVCTFIFILIIYTWTKSTTVTTDIIPITTYTTQIRTQ